MEKNISVWCNFSKNGAGAGAGLGGLGRMSHFSKIFATALYIKPANMKLL